MSIVHDHLRAMRNRLSDLGRWTAGAMARDSCSRPVMPDHPDAVSWCLVGAAYAEVAKYDAGVDPDTRRYVTVSLLRALHSSAQRLYNDKHGLSHLNDELGHRVVLAVVSDACIHPTGERCGEFHALGGGRHARCVRDVHEDDKHVSLALEPGEWSTSWRGADTVLLGTD